MTKAAGDKAVQRMIADEHLPAVVIRPGAFFGSGDRLHFGRLAARLHEGDGVIVGPGDNALPFVYAFRKAAVGRAGDVPVGRADPDGQEPAGHDRSGLPLVALVPCRQVTCWMLAAWASASWRRLAAGCG